MSETESLPERAGDTANDYVAERIRIELARRRLTAAELAARMSTGGLSFGSAWVQRRAAGRAQLAVNDIQLIARALDIPMAALLADLIPEAQR